MVVNRDVKDIERLACIASAKIELDRKSSAHDSMRWAMICTCASVRSPSWSEGAKKINTRRLCDVLTCLPTDAMRHVHLLLACVAAEGSSVSLPLVILTHVLLALAL